ncbi:MAG: hypothetical protein IJ128_02395, partial [Firmicutes bacterium]|nr:hypothetical protein [Bacillota bacterium]
MAFMQFGATVHSLLFANFKNDIINQGKKALRNVPVLARRLKVAKCKLRNALAIALGALFVMCILSVPAYAESVSYVDADGKDMGSTECSIVTEEMTEGWYVTDANHDTFDKRIKVSGNVNLILKNDTVLKAQAGIEVPSGSELTIWAQRTDKRMGCLEAVRKDGLGSDKTAGIGCNSKGDAGNITINGGEIRANGSNWEQEVVMKPGGPGISGEEVTINGGDITAIGKGRTSNAVSGAGINGKTININGGTVEATGGYWGGAGIGCNYRGASANVTINGGTVTATGGYCSGSGIGGAEGASFSGNIKITGGTVTTTGMGRGPGIGSSGGPLVGTITISGGDVTANGGDSDTHSGAGIGGPGLSGTIKISGGTVKATGGEY